MIWYIADTSAGDTFFVLAGPYVSRQGFFDQVMLAIEEEDPQCTPHDLTLHRFNDEDAPYWISGIVPPSGESWTTLHKRTLIGEIKYTHPGEWKLEELLPL